MLHLHAILSRYPADCRPSHIEPLGAAGGMSGAAFWRITAPRGWLALRRWPTEHPTPERLDFIHSVLRHAYQRGIDFIPVPLTTTDGKTFIQHHGHLWELAPWMPGTADYEQSPSHPKLRAALTALAQIHVATADFTPRRAPSPNVASRLARLTELARGGTQELSRAISDATWREIAPLAREFMTLLPGAIPHAIAQLEPLAATPLPLQPCLRDIWHDHVLFTGNEVTGIIDFGAVDIETPAADIARLLGSIIVAEAASFGEQVRNFGEQTGSLLHVDPTGWQTGLAAYDAVSPLAAEERRAITAFDTSGTLLAGCNWIRWIYIDGRQFENREQVIERFRRIVARIGADN
jgi:Ser/Thr protein kinase RdoA (MazF antagonist)